MRNDAVGLKTCSWSKLEQFQISKIPRLDVQEKGKQTFMMHSEKLQFLACANLGLPLAGIAL